MMPVMFNLLQTLKLKTEMRTQKMELEARIQGAEDGRRQCAEQMSEITSKQQYTIAKQVVPYLFTSTFLASIVHSRHTQGIKFQLTPNINYNFELYRFKVRAFFEAQCIRILYSMLLMKRHRLLLYTAVIHTAVVLTCYIVSLKQPSVDEPQN